MEYWSFPPNYDPAYRPDAGSRFWFPQRETMDPGVREQRIVERLQEVMRYAWDNAPFYRQKWGDAGIHPDHIRSLDDFERVPVVTKQELRQSQERAQPFGDYLCIPPEDVHHIHGTSGTTGRPTIFAIGRDDWATIANNGARCLWGMGIRPGDTVFIASILSLYMGSWGALIAAERLGATAFPFGAGASGMTARAAHWLNIVKPAVLYGTPSYALHLAEVAQAEGLNPRELGLKRMFFSGEPGASIPSIRERIEEAFGARVYDSGTMAEMTPWISAAGTEETAGMVLYQDMVYHEVCDPQTYRRVSYGSRGTPVYTHLERTSQPMIRLASGDLTLWVDGPTPCGRTYPFLPQGIFGRIDDMFTIRGENIYPSEIDAVLNMLPNYGGEHRIIVTRTHVMDELLIQLEGNADVYQQPDVQQALHAAAERELLRVLGVRTRVEIVPANTFPRTDAKARRVIDNRDLFRSLTTKLER